MKLFKFIPFLLIVLNLFVCEAASSDNWQPPKYQSSQILKYKFNPLACFMETTTGAVIDLSKLCRQNPETPPKTNLARTSKDYDYKRIEKFNLRVYGD